MALYDLLTLSLSLKYKDYNYKDSSNNKVIIVINQFPYVHFSISLVQIVQCDFLRIVASISNAIVKSMILWIPIHTQIPFTTD